MMIEYYVIDPTKNITILVDTAVPVELQPEIAGKLMSLEPEAEQVGFVGGSSLRMAGGEFCGNAAISAAALKAYKGGAVRGEKQSFYLDVSGTDEPVSVETECVENGKFVCRADMPKPLSAEKTVKSFGGREYDAYRVDFGSIVHFILTEKTEKCDAEAAVRKWCGEEKTVCAGLMFFDERDYSLVPLVYVSQPPTMFWENSCASGTAAVGVYLADREKRAITASLSEPGGKLSVSVSPEKIILEGSAVIIKHNKVEI